MKNWPLLLLLSFSAHAFAERTMSVQHLQGEKSYFKINIQNSLLLEGSYPGWCADWDKTIEDNVPYTYKYYSSYSEEIPEGLIDHPENLDMMNWIINKDFAGKDAGNGLGIFTSGDVQLAIWTLLDDNFDGSSVGPFSQERVDRIVNKALRHGADFYPTCRQDIGIIIDPGTPQSTIIEIPRSRFYKCNVPDDDGEI